MAGAREFSLAALGFVFVGACSSADRTFGSVSGGSGGASDGGGGSAGKKSSGGSGNQGGSRAAGGTNAARGGANQSGNTSSGTGETGDGGTAGDSAVEFGGSGGDFTRGGSSIGGIGNQAGGTKNIGDGGSGGATQPTSGGTAAGGGTKATGSSTGSGGTLSTGGTKATGGTTSAGGTKATGGTTSTGGTVASTGGTKATDFCSPNPCQHSGTCANGATSYSCSCTARYTGDNCEYLEFKVADLVDGTAGTEAKYISGDGHVVLAEVESSPDYLGRLVDFGGMNLLLVGQLIISGIRAGGISRDGGVIGGSALPSAGTGTMPFIVTGITPTWMSWSPKAAPVNGWLLDVSADGTTVVGRYADSTTSYHCSGFRRTSAGVELIDPLQDELCVEPRGVSANGNVVVGFSFGSDGSSLRGFRYVASTKQRVNLQMPAASWVRPVVNDVSSDGKVAVGTVQINGINHAVKWVGDSGQAQDLGPGNLYGTNTDGSVSVGYTEADGAAIWTASESGKTVVSVLGSNPDIGSAKLSSACCVSEDGKVVAGTAIDPNTKRRAWVARLP